MDKYIKVIKTVYWTLLFIGSIAVGIIIAKFSFTKSQVIGIYIGWLSIVLIIAIIVDIIWMKDLNKKLAAAFLILTVENDPDRYMTELDKLLKNKKSQHLKQVYSINTAAAYCAKRDYKKANDILLNVNTKKLVAVNKAVYWADLAETYFYLGDNQKACEIMDKNRKEFETHRNTEHLGPTLAVLYVFEALVNGEVQKASQILESAYRRWPENRIKDDYEYLKDYCTDTKNFY